MEIEHFGIIHFIDVVARENHHIIGIIPLDKGDILINGVGGTLVPVGFLLLLVGGQHMHACIVAVQVPGLAVADVVVELQGLILGEHTHSLDAGVYAVGKREINDAVFPAEGHRGLGEVSRQNAQTAALAAGKQHGHDFLFG